MGGESFLAEKKLLGVNCALSDGTENQNGDQLAAKRGKINFFSSTDNER